jgi:hypothetical protein
VTGRGTKQRPDTGAKAMPSEDEIRAMCREIQDGWTPTREERARGVFETEYVELKTFSIPEARGHSEY